MTTYNTFSVFHTGKPLTKKQESAVETVLWSLDRGAIGEKNEPQKVRESDDGIVYRTTGYRKYFVEIHHAGNTGVVSGAGMAERAFRYETDEIERITDESVDVSVDESDEESDDERDTETMYYDDAESESDVELDSENFVTWECYDTMPYIISRDGISVNLNHRPSFFPDESLYRAVAYGDDDSYIVEWRGTAELCNWRTPCRIVSLDEYNAENVGNAQAHVSPAAAESTDLPEVSTEHAIAPQTQSCAVEQPVDLLGNRIPATTVPYRQLELFDKTEYRRTIPGTHAIVLRENGEMADGVVDHANQWKIIKQFTFTAHETGKMYTIPLRCCAVTWAGDVAVIAIPETELSRRISLYGMFASCRLF